jgi:REP-associated tyrosine transposase
MKYDPNKHHRRSIRLKGYDYTSPGAYFVTICTQGRECVLDDPVVKGIITDVWRALPQWFPTIALDEFMVMPNHVHLVTWLQANVVGATLAVAQPAIAQQGQAQGLHLQTRDWVIPSPEKINVKPSLGNVMDAFKSLVFTVYLDWIETHDPNRRAKFWQRDYYEHIVRNERELNAIRQYIRDNPLKWELDRDNPNNIRRLPPPSKTEDYLADIL